MHLFFNFFFSKKECETFAQRWRVFQLVHERYTYSEIRGISKAGTTTINRAKQALRSDQGGATMMDRFQRTHPRRSAVGSEKKKART